MIDQTDLQIIELLRHNSKLQYRDIGNVVHLTGQAVSNRISKLEQLGIIKGYSVIIDDALLGKAIIAYITVFMKSTNEKSFQDLLSKHPMVVEANRISGDGCYILKSLAKSQNDLNELLDSILEYGNYRVNIVLTEIK